MSFCFDLISDLHLETWPAPFEWSHRATSPVCVVAGDIARDHDTVVATLTHLGRCYQAVFYIDGNEEHSHHWHDLAGSYALLQRRLAAVPNVVYLHDNVAVIDGVAILGTNGWWGFDLSEYIDRDQTMAWYKEKWAGDISDTTLQHIRRMSEADAAYMWASVGRLQHHTDVDHVVMVTHTVPDARLIDHDIELEGTWRFNCMGNRGMIDVLANDSHGKIHTWCFGHYHRSVDQIRDQVRFVNNCQGRAHTAWSQHVYHPRRIVIDD